MNGQSMSDKLGLGPQRHEIKFGPSFMNSKSTSFHTLRYDFKPASVDASKRAIVDVGSNHQVTVTVPHLDGSGTAQTVFKGSQRPYQKECVLIIDRDTGEITLEKLSACIQLKKTRQESSQKHHIGNTSLSGNSNNAPSNWSSSSENKKTSPPESSSSSRPRHSSKLPKSLSARVPLNSPLQASPSYSHSHKSPTTSQTQKSPQLTSSSGLSPTTTPGSLPVIGFNDMNDSPANLFGTSCNYNSIEFTPSPRIGSPTHMDADEEDDGGAVGVLSDSSSDSSSDESNLSDSESDSNPSNNDTNKPSVINGQINGTPSLPHENFLKEDLQLSESSGSDSD